MAYRNRTTQLELIYIPERDKILAYHGIKFPSNDEELLKTIWKDNN